MKILFINLHGCGPGYGSCCNYSGYPYFPQYLPRACLRQYLCMFCQMCIGQYHNPITFLSVNKVQIFLYLFPGQLGSSIVASYCCSKWGCFDLIQWNASLVLLW